MGCGNLAYHIAEKLNTLNQFKICVVNHKPNKNLNYFKKLNCEIYTSLNKIPTNASLYIISVKDSAIDLVAKKLTTIAAKELVVHTSGSVNLNVLTKYNLNSGVFYPLQSFSFNTSVDWENTPLLIEGKTNNEKKKLNLFAKLFSNNVLNCTSMQRLNYHLNAVIVNNFTNALYTLSESNCTNNKLKFKLLFPIIETTLSKLKENGALASQTGPAKRNDLVVIKKHLKLLKSNSIEYKTYKLLTQLIKNQHA
ncbi:MAG: DUF2520 domain-containing protein [Bacteroidia bacterium]